MIIHVHLKVYGNLRDKQNMNNGNAANVTTNDSSSFKYRSSILANPASDVTLKNNCSTKISKWFLEIIKNAIDEIHLKLSGTN